jgi:ADP-ribosylglycohydrolase
MKTTWLSIRSQDLLHELCQVEDEGKQLSADLERNIREFASKGDDYLATSQGQAEAGALLDRTIALPIRKEYPFTEPSDLEGIRAQRPPAVPLPDRQISGDTLRNKIYGAWLGRAYGCYHGKPVEGLRRAPGDTFILESFLKKTGQWPLRGYFSLDYPEETLCSFNLNRSWRSGPPFMPEDDDTNYTTAAFALMQQKGCDFTPGDVASFWLQNIPAGRVCTAERVAYRNFCLNISPPASASYRNVYREWIGAQIRADFFGYAAPRHPELAAEWAWRDACISHVKNGIYGEMWAAAMLASAYVTSDIETIIRAGLAQIPGNCRLSAAINEVLAWRAARRSYDEAVLSIHARWDEKDSHHWCHTIPNAQICAVALLWDETDYAVSISRAILPGFDTDCNGATVGSIMGMILGAAALPQELVGRLNDRIRTGAHGYQDCSIKTMAAAMAELVEKIGR